jgi:CubicO group peptidase (beta-lactamase class C family)
VQTPVFPELLDLTCPGVLQERVAASARRDSRERVLVGLSHQDRHALAASTCYANSKPGDQCVLVGCLAKLFTLTLIRRAMAAGHFSLDSPVSRHLPRGSARCFDAVTFKHLMEHTHGLDDAGLVRAPTAPDGSIDLSALCQQLAAAPAIAPPGHLYSYSNAGAWLLGAILEQCFDRRYEQILREELFDPLELHVRHLPSSLAAAGETFICPASGGTLAISVRDLLSFLSCQVAAGPERFFGAAPMQEACSELTALPGWHSFERGIRQGWKYYGSGWFGHSSESSGAALLTRLHPQRRIALVVASEHRPPLGVACSLLGKAVPELASLRTPKLLDPAQSAALELERLTGEFGNRALCIRISASNGALELKAFQRRHDSVATQAFATAKLVPARDRMFLTMPRDARLFTFVQYIGERATGSDLLWSGKIVVPRRPAHP